MKPIALLLILFTGSLAFPAKAQPTIYRDTVKKLQYSPDGSEVEYIRYHVRSFQPEPISYSEPVGYTNFFAAGILLNIRFPDGFESGFDSLFIKGGDHTEPYLATVWEFQDHKGTATYASFFPNGKPRQQAFFVHHSVNTYPFIDSLAKRSPDDETPNRKVLPESEWRRDTAYFYFGQGHGELRSWYDNGQIAMIQTLDKGKREGPWYGYHYNGKLGEHFNFQDDKVNGSWKKWYSNGNKKIETEYRMGRQTRKQLTWYESGRPESLTYYFDNLPHGAAQRWHENGQLQSEVQYFYGDTIGTYQLYHPNGQLKERGTYDSLYRLNSEAEHISYFKKQPKKLRKHFFRTDKEGKEELVWEFQNESFRSGEFSYWDSTGTLLFTDTYEFGIRVKRKSNCSQEVIDLRLYPLEERMSIIQVELALPREARRNIRTFEVGAFEMVKTDTFALEWKAPSGDSLAIYTEVLSVGEEANANAYVYECFYPSGAPQMKLSFREDLRRMNRKEKLEKRLPATVHAIYGGECKYWYPNGNLKWERMYKNFEGSGMAEIEDEITYYEHGKIKSERHQLLLPVEGSTAMTVTMKVGTQKEWHPNGQLKRETPYYDGSKEGEEKIWGEDGTLLRHFRYKKGKLHDWQYYYDNTGKLSKKEYYLEGSLRKSSSE